MRGTKAKRLRRAAQEKTVGLVEAAYNIPVKRGQDYVVIGKPGQPVFQQFEVKTFWRDSGQVTLVEGCTRQVYQAMKARAR